MLGKKVRELRKAKKLSQRDVSLETGLTERTLYNIESGASTNPTLKTIKVLADFYDVPVSELLEESHA